MANCIHLFLSSNVYPREFHHWESLFVAAVRRGIDVRINYFEATRSIINCLASVAVAGIASEGIDETWTCEISG